MPQVWINTVTTVGDVMTRNDPDPVTRWATEHYGFHDDPARGAATEASPVSPSPAAAGQSPAGQGAGVRRRGLLTWGGGLLSLALLVGMGAVAVADDGGDAAPESGVHIVIDRVDGGADPQVRHPHGDHRE
jgi:hypothetical protein